MRQRLAVLATGALAAAACSVPTDTAATPITSVPYDLLTSNSSTTTTSAPDQADARFDLTLAWALNDGRNAIFPLQRPVDSPPSVTSALEALLGDLTEAERELYPNLGTRILESLQPTLATPPVQDSVLTITIGDDTLLSESAINVVIVAQLVCTFVALESVNGVQLQDLAGETVPLTGFNAITIDGPASESDFNGCEAPEELTNPVLDEDGNPIETEEEG